MIKLIIISILVLLFNIPFGYWRANVKGFSVQWFLAIHIPVPFIIAVRIFLDIGFSWYNIPNSILITSTTDILSWYWRDSNNADGFAGSWFFHQFWEQINQSQTVGDAFNSAKNFVLSGQVKSINEIQSPLIQDNLGIKDTWYLTNSP